MRVNRERPTRATYEERDYQMAMLGSWPPLPNETSRPLREQSSDPELTNANGTEDAAQVNRARLIRAGLIAACTLAIATLGYGIVKWGSRK